MKYYIFMYNAKKKLVFFITEIITQSTLLKNNIYIYI